MNTGFFALMSQIEFSILKYAKPQIFDLKRFKIKGPKLRVENFRVEKFQELLIPAQRKTDSIRHLSLKFPS